MRIFRTHVVRQVEAVAHVWAAEAALLTKESLEDFL